MLILSATARRRFVMPDSSLPDSCFAFVPNEAQGANGSKSLRKLRLCNDAGKLDCGIIGAAAATFSSGGFRGNRVSLPSSAVAGAKRKIRAARASAKCGGEAPESIA
jgi:hypothetical protein